MRWPARPAPRWVEAAAVALLLVSAMIEPRVTIVVAVALLVAGLIIAATTGSSRHPRGQA